MTELDSYPIWLINMVSPKWIFSKLHRAERPVKVIELGMVTLAFIIGFLVVSPTTNPITCYARRVFERQTRNINTLNLIVNFRSERVSYILKLTFNLRNKKTLTFVNAFIMYTIEKRSLFGDYCRTQN